MIEDISSNQGNFCLTLLDTKRESEIGLGTDWPFEALNAGECLVSDQFSGAEIGDEITLKLQIVFLLKAMIKHYNNDVKAEDDPAVSINGIKIINVSCKIVG